MIRGLDEILGRDNGMRGQIVGFTLAGILEGVVFALMIPILKAVVRGDYGAAIPWVVSAALVAAACGAVRWIAENRAYRIGIERFAGGIMHRLGEHLVQIPLGWFSKANRGAFTRLVTEGTAILMSIPGMIVAQLVTVTVTPATPMRLTVPVATSASVSSVHSSSEPVHQWIRSGVVIAATSLTKSRMPWCVVGAAVSVTSAVMLSLSMAARPPRGRAV